MEAQVACRHGNVCALTALIDDGLVPSALLIEYPADDPAIVDGKAVMDSRVGPGRRTRPQALTKPALAQRLGF